MSMWEIILVVAAVLAVILTGLFIGVCLLIAWTKDTLGGRSRQDMYGNGAPDHAPTVAEGRHRSASRLPVASWRSDR